MIPVNRPIFSGNEKKYLMQCIETGWVSSEGEFIRKFEMGVAELMGCKYGIAVSNGSAALDIAVSALGIGAGDEVILPAFTIISCAAAIVRAGATPIVIDSDPLSWNMDVAKIEEAITPRTKAIMVVHIYGIPVDMHVVCQIARKYDLFVIEDAAEQIGQTFNGRPVGSFGDIATLSFYPNKQITTGEGGMIVTNDINLDYSCRSLRNLCFDKDRRYIHDRLGWNFRMSNIQAALGLAQLENIQHTLTRKKRIGEIYQELLGKIDSLQLPIKESKYAQNIYWVFGILLKDHIKIDAVETIKRMRKSGVDCRHFFWPIHKQPALCQFFEGISCPVAENLAERGFYLPSGVGNTDEEIEISAQTLIEVLK
jgi:perosamine synthetase